MSEPFDSKDFDSEEDFGYWSLDIEAGLATIAKLQDLVSQVDSLKSQIISMLQSKELEFFHLLDACVDLAYFQIKLHTEITDLYDSIQNL
jgi:hypothetical protein